jgi:hypothetical protein
MFTCSSCGYEANADSAPACSLCGTKKPTKDARGSSAAPKAKAPPPGDDDLANAAQLVADEAEGSSPAPAKAKASAAKASAAKGQRSEGRTAVETTTGVLRLSKEPPPLDTASMMLGALVGAILGYVVGWIRLHHAPAGFTDALPALAGAVILGLVGRFTFASYLENTLRIDARETFAGAGAAAVGGAFLIFTVIAFAIGGSVGDTSSINAPGASLVGVSGDALLEHMALTRPFTVQVRTDKFAILKSGPRQVRIPRSKLTQEDVDEILKNAGLPVAQLELLASDDPVPSASALPGNFSQELFLNNLRDSFGIQKDVTDKPNSGRIPLVRARSRGGNEQLSIPDRAFSVGDLQGALPQGVKLWVGLALGIPHDPGAVQDKLMSEVIDRSRPEN